MLRRAADLQVPAVLPDGRGGLRNYPQGNIDTESVVSFGRAALHN